MGTFHDWQIEKGKELPELSSRVFALRGKAYPGSGWHYILEKLLGNVIVAVMDHERFNMYGKGDQERIADEIISEVLYDDLIDRLEKAEKSVKG